MADGCKVLCAYKENSCNIREMQSNVTQVHRAPVPEERKKKKWTRRTRFQNKLSKYDQREKENIRT